MSLLHVMPEAAETYAGWAKCAGYEEGDAFPLPYLLYMVGYILILIIDRWLAASFHIADETNEVKVAAPMKSTIINMPKRVPDSDDSISVGDEKKE